MSKEELTGAPTKSVEELKKDLDREAKRIVHAGERKLSQKYIDLKNELKVAQLQAELKVSHLHTEGHLGSIQEPAPSKDDNVSSTMNLNGAT